MQVHPQIGFHGAGNGIGTYLSRLDLAGIPFHAKAVDDFGYALEALSYTNADHKVITRWTMPNGMIDYLPLTGNSQEDANILWNNYMVELNKAISNSGDLWKDEYRNRLEIEMINEVDTHTQANALFETMYYLAEKAVANNWRVALGGFNAGQPEVYSENQWLMPSAVRLLEYIAQHHDQISLSFHEGKITGSPDDPIESFYNWLVGRYEHLFNTCDNLGIKRPRIHISEWAWGYNSLPSNDDILFHDLDYLGRLVAGQEIGIYLWNLQAGSQWGNLPVELSQKIPAITTFIMNTTYEVDEPLPDPNRVGDAREPYNRVYWRVNSQASKQTWLDTAREVYKSRGTMGASADDAGIGVGLANKTVIEVGAEFDQSIIEAWYQKEYGVTDVRHIGFHSDDFDFTSFPVIGYKYITQAWGANPQNYNDFGLPGHDGIDLRAPTGTPIVAVANGHVFKVELNPNAHNYGIHVRIQHANSYQTVYAHLSQATVNEGDWVAAGTIIGYAGNTGNSFGAHLHLSLKRIGYTYSDQYGVWPYNLHNPTPYLDKFFDPPTAGKGAIGLHLRADPDRPKSAEWAEVETLRRSSKPDVIKLLHAHPESAFVDSATKLGLEATYVIRIFQSWGGRAITPYEFVNWNLAELNRKIDILTEYGVAYSDIHIEIHNEPNLTDEGLGFSWGNGREFGIWLQSVAQQLREQLPNGVNLMYPGLSPGWAIAGVRAEDKQFFLDSAFVLSDLDSIGVHAYWSANFPMQQAFDHVNWVKSRTGLPIYITECSINDRPAILTANEYGQQYAQFCNGIDVAGILFFVGSASNPYFEPECWVTESNQSKGIAQALISAL